MALVLEELGKHLLLLAHPLLVPAVVDLLRRLVQVVLAVVELEHKLPVTVVVELQILVLVVEAEDSQELMVVLVVRVL
jgi:hypothetical protein